MKESTVKYRTALVAALACVAAMLGVSSAAHADNPTVTCADFGDQADAQAYYEAHIGPGQAPDQALDPDGNGVACDQGELPCPCDYGVSTPEPSTPLPAAAVVQSKVLMSVSTTRPKSKQRVWFTITRLAGTATLTRADGKVMLQEKQGGTWRTVQGSRAWTLHGRYRTWYYLSGHVEVRAKTVGPVSYSAPVKLATR